jgi:hypothetical protein
VANATFATTAGSATVANSVSGSNVVGAVANATFATSATNATTATTATSATTAGTVTTAAQPNITSVGTLSSLSVTGNISGSFILGNGSALTGVVSSGTSVLLTTDQTVAGNKSFTGTTTLGPYVETTAGVVNTGASFTPTMSNGPVQRITANSNFTLNAPSGMVAGQSITLVITQDATGNRIMTSNAAYRFAYGVKTLSTAANSIDMMSIFYDGTNYLCNLVKGYTA